MALSDRGSSQKAPKKPGFGGFFRDPAVILITLQASLVGGIALLIWLFNSWHHAQSFAMGGLASFLSLSLMAGSFQLILRKKLVALGVFLIVIKYSILGTIIYLILQEPGSQIPWFFAGLAALVVTGLLSTIVKPKPQVKSEEIESKSNMVSDSERTSPHGL